MARSRLSFLLGRGTFFLLLSVLLATVGASWVLAQDLSIDSNAILNHLDAAIRWYRDLNKIDVTSGQPSDVLYLQNAQNLANQALQLDFQSAQAEAALAAAQKASAASGQADQTVPQENNTQQNITKAVGDTAARIQQNQAQIEVLDKQIGRAGAKKRQELMSRRDALQGEVELDKALQEALGKIQSFVNSSENVNTGLAGKINDLKRTVPELAAVSGNHASSPKTPSNGQSTKASRADQSGLIGQASILFSQMGDVHDIDQLIAETTQLRKATEQLQAPLREALRATLKQGRDAATQPPASDPAQAQAMRRTLTQLTARFKHISEAAIPLRQEIILLDQCRANLEEWRGSVIKEYTHVLRSLLTRIAIILFALGIVAVFSMLWRRATLRYVRDSRRRRQLLLIRRFVIGFLMTVVVALGFISEFSSLATFAGFITAGLAVALQTVILSIAAYFFLIGRYGVRVGDRITVSGVTGDVIDIGLVRMYLMELGGTGVDLYPTGRAVVFSNSVLFQATPLYKQIPGTSFTWHEVAITLSSQINPAVEQKLLAAVNSIFWEYRSSIERQHREVEQLIDAPTPSPAPQSQLRFGENGTEFVVRYPVEIRRAAEIDERIARKLTEVMANSPELKVSGAPRLRSAIKT